MSNHLDTWIQTYPDFPKPGILFYDIAPIIEYPDRLRYVCQLIRDAITDWQPDVLVGIDSRGFFVCDARGTLDGSWRCYGA